MPHASPNLKPTFLRWRIVAMLSGIVFLAHFNRVSISVAANAHFIGPDKLSEEQMGLVYSAFLLVYTVAMLPGGWLIDRIGPRRALTGMGLGLGFWAAMTGVLGWANSSIAALFVPLLAIRALAGLTGVPLHPGAARSVSLWVPVPERAFANGVVTAGALFGIALTYPVFGTLMDAVGWQSAFAICGIVLMLFSLLGIATADANYVTLWFALALGSLGLCEGVFWTMAPILEPRRGGLACALVNTGGNGIGMLAPIITPILGLHFGWNSAIFVACLISAIGGVLWLGIDETPRSRPEPRTASDHPILE